MDHRYIDADDVKPRLLLKHKPLRRLPPLPFVVAFLAVGSLVLVASAQPSDQEIGEHLQAIHRLTEQALEASRAAEQAATVAEVKQQADRVFAIIWGVPSGLADETARGAEKVHGWKTRWQSDTDDFELEDPAKFGVEPPEITDPTKLGIEGLGRHVRKQLWTKIDSTNIDPHLNHTIASLSNVIGWMRMDYAPSRGGMPRIDLTYQWDAPSEFWLSTADTGWILDAYAQTLNILKTNYAGNAATARKHAADLSRLLEKALKGEDANENGSIEPAMMEGGLNAAMQHARLAGFSLP